MDYRLKQAIEISEGFYEIAEEIRKVVQAKFKRPPLPRGATLRPGADTPLWLALAAAIRPWLRTYGAKAILGRQLGVHRGRITEYFVKHSAMPDAERTLLLLEWLGKARTRIQSPHSTPPVRNTNKVRRATRTQTNGPAS
jgi:hypothetical protein